MSLDSKNLNDHTKSFFIIKNKITNAKQFGKENEQISTEILSIYSDYVYFFSLRYDAV